MPIAPAVVLILVNQIGAPDLGDGALGSRFINIIIPLAILLSITILLFTKRRFRRSVPVDITVAALLFGFYFGEENWRGKHYWEHFRREWEAKGEKFGRESLVPPPVPDEQNFALTPLIYSSYGRFYDKLGHERLQSDTNIVDRLTMDIHENSASSNLLSTASWTFGKQLDLPAWQNHFRTLATQTNQSFPSLLTAQSAAKDVLVALGRFTEVLDELRQVARLPESRFPLEYDKENPCEINFSHLDALRCCCRVLSLRAVAELQDGQPAAAQSEIGLMFRLIASVQGEPFLLSCAARATMVRSALQPVWEGLAGHRWSDKQLATNNADLAKLDFVADYNLAMHAEMISQIQFVEFARRHWGDLLAQSTSQSVSTNKIKIAARMFPSGWFYQNQLWIAEMMLRYNIPAVDTNFATFSPAIINEENRMVAADSHPVPYRWLGSLLLPTLGNAAEKFAWAQASTDMARIAIALERYRLVHGGYPEKLDVLSPQFLVEIPHDVIGGQPFHYRHETNGQFILYSIGWNERDDGGAIVLKKDSKTTLDLSEGDWVWRYPAAAETGKKSNF